MAPNRETKSKKRLVIEESSESESEERSPNVSRSRSISRTKSATKSNSRSSKSRSLSKSVSKKSRSRTQDDDESDNDEGSSSRKHKVYDKDMEIKTGKNAAFDADNYDTKELRDAIFDNPGMYIGNIQHEERLEKVFNVETKAIENVTMTEPKAMMQFFYEGIANAVDAIINTRRENPKAKCHVDIHVDPHYIEMTNYSSVIPVVKHKKLKDKYIPEVVFGTLLSSSNYKKKDADGKIIKETRIRHGGGANGVGVKVDNIFSLEFEAEVNDPGNKLHYYQKWEDHMLNPSDPEITKSTSKIGYVRIKFLIDFERFDINAEDGYSENVINLFARIAMDNSYAGRCTIKFNDIPFSIKNIRVFGNTLFGDEIKNKKPLIHYVWPLDTEVEVSKLGIETAKDGYTQPLLEMIAYDNPYRENTSNFSYVNCLHTRDGGVHYELILEALSRAFLKKIKQSVKSDKVNINKRDVERHVSIILFVNVPDPYFSAQIKTKLEGWEENVEGALLKSDFKIPAAKFDAATKSWSTIDVLSRTLEEKTELKLKTTDGKKCRNVDIPNGHDANDAGTKLSQDCVLVISEGISAGTAVTEIGNAKYGKDKYGNMPIRGKLLNVSKATNKRILENEEIKLLKKVLGLRQDYKYDTQEEINTLRYGRVMIAADADVDGYHIVVLIANYFKVFFPKLVENDFIYILITPIARARKGKQIMDFFSLGECLRWEKTPEAKGWKGKYYKGLGSITKTEVEGLIDVIKELSCNMDKESVEKMSLVMDKKNDRKEWILSRTDFEELNYDTHIITMDTYINQVFIQFCHANIIRHIPLYADGLKPSGRKIIWQMLKRWGLGLSANDKNHQLLPITTIIKPGAQEMTERHKTEVKVSQFMSNVAENTEYHHGEVSLEGTIYGYTHDFPGSNNIPLMIPAAMCGTRLGGGKDHVQPRYGLVIPNWKLIPYIFHKQDSMLLEMQYEDNNEIEPKFLLTTIPLSILNNVEGIAIGWSTYIPSFNPKDIIRALRRLIKGKPCCKLPPHYNFFKGNTEIIKTCDKSSCTKETQMVVSRDEDGRKTVNYVLPESKTYDDIPDDDDSYTLVTIGNYEYYEGKGEECNIHITELPIGVWNNKFIKDCNKLASEGMIKNIRDSSSTELVDIELHNCNLKHVVKDLGLANRINLNNMHMIDFTNTPILYRNAKRILEDFYEFRLPFYELRRERLIEMIDVNIKLLRDKAKFIKCHNDGTLNTRGVKKPLIMENMDKLEIPRNIYDMVKISECCEEKILELNEEIDKEMVLRDYYDKKTGKELWLMDLDDLEDAYDNWYAEKEEHLEKDYKKMMKMKDSGGVSAASAYKAQLEKKKNKGKKK